MHCPHATEAARPKVSRRRRGDPKAANLAIPSRITMPWLSDNVPGMNENEKAALVQVMSERGWSEGEIEDYVFASG